MNDLIAVQVLAAQDYLPQIVARLGFRQRFPPLVQLQEGLGKREDVTEAQGNGWSAGCGQDEALGSQVWTDVFCPNRPVPNITLGLLPANSSTYFNPYFLCLGRLLTVLPTHW